MQKSLLSKLSQRGVAPLIIVVVVAALAVLGFFLYQNYNKAKVKETSEAKNEKPKVVGILNYLKVIEPVADGFKGKMAELGYVEGKNIVYEYRLADGNPQKLEQDTKELFDKKVDLILAITSVAGRAALKESTMSGRTDMPIVYGLADNPTKTGLAKSLISSGNNTTGVSNDTAEVTAKKFEFLKQINPNAKRVGLFVPDFRDPAANFGIAEVKEQAPKFGITIVEYKGIKGASAKEANPYVKQVTDNIKPGEIDAYIWTAGPVTTNVDNAKLVIEMCKRLKIACISFADLGALFDYTLDYQVLGEQSALMADKIFKGAKPADIPLENPNKFNLTLNLKTAKEIGVTFPESLLGIASRKIE